MKQVKGRNWKNHLVIILMGIMIIGILTLGSVQAASNIGIQKNRMPFMDLNQPGTERRAFDKKITVDDSSLQLWQNYINQNTSNVGHIWTDKSVYDHDAVLYKLDEKEPSFKVLKDDSDFLIGLSALSSTSNIKTMTPKPLDIVMVLDVSGSMNNLEGKIYSSDLDTSQIYYYYASDDTVREVTYSQENQSWGYMGSGWFGVKKWITVTPKKNQNDRSGTQLYNLNKIRALKDSAGGFIKKTAEENTKISDPDLHHRISIVKFADDSYNNNYGNDFTRREGYNYTQRLNALTAYTNTNVVDLTNLVEKLSPAGATAADFGFEMAKKELIEQGWIW